jgi:hypothetical protein
MALEALVNGEHRRACQLPRRRGKAAAAGQRLDDAALTGKMTTGGISTRSQASCAGRHRP